MYFRYLILFTLTIYSLSANCQLFSSDQNPPSVKWEQINTENFQLIYPLSMHHEAQRMANLVEGVIGRVSASLGKQPRKISIILQNQGTSSNGFVQLAPRRSEFFTTPSQSFDFQNWLNGLAVHELRHVVQFDKLTGKFNRFPLQELGLAIFGITLPSWYYEGDAVTTETSLTQAGRGRIPEWYLALRTNTLSNKNYSYSKDYFGSVRDFTPGYYQLGFFMAAKLRRDFGNGINDSILSRISRNPIRPYSFSNSVKKYTGMNTKTLHDSTLNELKKLWTEQLKIARPETYISLTKRQTKTPESYLLPVAAANGTILFLKESKAHPAAIYQQQKNGKAKKILNIGAQEIPWFSYGANKIIWDELRYDGRYLQRSFNVINSYDVKTKIKRQLTHRSRLFAPALSADGSTIAAIEVSLSNKISLIEIHPETGKEIRRYASPGNAMLQMPAFHLSGKKIAVVGVSTLGKTIYELDRASGKFTPLMPLQLQEILRPFYAGDQVIFKAHFNGIDNVYRVDPTTKEIVQLSSVTFGANHPFYDASMQTILFSNYTPEGYDISSMPFTAKAGIPVLSLQNASVNYADPVFKQEGGNDVLANLPEKEYPTKRFREINNLFYFHSIIPTIDEASGNNRNYGLFLESDNKLNTLGFYTGYQFNNALRKSEYETGFSYRRYFPVLNVAYRNQPGLLNRRTTVAGKTVFTPVSWRENELKADVSIPLLMNKFNNTYRATFKVGTSYTTRYDIENNFKGLITTLDFPMHYELSASTTSRRSARDLTPKWGQSVFFRYRHFPFENQLQGKIFTFRSTFYFPGFAQNHSMQASFNFQDGSGTYNKTVDISRVSGYSYLSPTTNTRNTLLLSYKLPLFYPDWEIGPLAYIKRLRGGLFADFENIDKRELAGPRSYGFELRADLNLLRFPLPNFDLGGKVIFLNEKSKQNPIFETIVNYNF